jgi:hypothetical protein
LKKWPSVKVDLFSAIPTHSPHLPSEGGWAGTTGSPGADLGGFWHPCNSVLYCNKDSINYYYYYYYYYTPL